MVIPRFGGGRVATGTAFAVVLVVLAIGVVQGRRRDDLAMGRHRDPGRFDATLREAVVERYDALPMAYHQAHPTGEKLAHVTTDPEAAAELPARMPNVLGMFLLFVVAAGWTLAVDPILALVGAAMIPALLMVNSFYQRRVEAPAAAAQDRLGRVTAVAHESFDGAFLVKTLGRAAPSGTGSPPRRPGCATRRSHWPSGSRCWTRCSSRSPSPRRWSWWWSGRCG